MQQRRRPLRQSLNLHTLGVDRHAHRFGQSAGQGRGGVGVAWILDNDARARPQRQVRDRMQRNGRGLNPVLQDPGLAFHPRRGSLTLLPLLLVTGGSLTLYAIRAPALYARRARRACRTCRSPRASAHAILVQAALNSLK